MYIYLIPRSCCSSVFLDKEHNQLKADTRSDFDEFYVDFMAHLHKKRKYNIVTLYAIIISWFDYTSNKAKYHFLSCHVGLKEIPVLLLIIYKNQRIS